MSVTKITDDALRVEFGPKLTLNEILGHTVETRPNKSNIVDDDTLARITAEFESITARRLHEEVT